MEIIETTISSAVDGLIIKHFSDNEGLINVNINRVWDMKRLYPKRTFLEFYGVSDVQTLCSALTQLISRILAAKKGMLSAKIETAPDYLTMDELKDITEAFEVKGITKSMRGIGFNMDIQSKHLNCFVVVFHSE